MPSPNPTASSRSRRRRKPRRSAGITLALTSALALTGTGFPAASAVAASDATAHPGLAAVNRYTPANITFPGNDGKSHTVTYDKNSFMIDGQRLSIWSGEIHYWRLPDVNGWRDIFQKMRANGYNAVSLYMFWGLHQAEENGDFDFSPGTIKDLDLLLTLAEEEGLYVIARPGPYVNAEISMGGLPAYMSNYGGGLRSNDAKALAASKSWLTAANQIISKHQITNGGGSVLVYQVENELVEGNNPDYEFLTELTKHVKSTGITVPLFHNDWNLSGRLRDTSRTGLDFYAYDAYPVGFNCSAGRNQIGDSEDAFHGFSPNSPNFITESQGGAFTPWGARYQASDCYKYTDEKFTRQWGVNNIGNGVTAFNFYMGFGGTNWGWTGSPASGFTSYDYGAGITEDRKLTPKASVQKEMGYYQRAVPQVASMDAVAAPRANVSSGSTVKVYQRQATDKTNSATGNGARTIALRLDSSNSETDTSFTIPLNLGKSQAAAETGFSHDDRDAAITYTGTWSQVADGTAAKGTVSRSTTVGDTASFKFNGTGVKLIVATGTDHGAFEVKVDDGDPTTVNTATVDTEQNKPTQHKAFEATGLKAGPHTITVKNLGGAKGNVLDVDAFDVTAPAAAEAVVVNNSDTSKITYAGSWEHASGKNWTAGDINRDESFSKTKGDSYSFTFTGVGFDLVAPYSVNHGSATVTVDGQEVGKTKEEVTGDAAAQKTVFSWRATDTSAPASHTVKVTVDGEPFPGSQDAFVSLDAVRYYPDATALPSDTGTVPAGTIGWSRIPQKADTSLKLHGRDALLLTADTKIAGHELYYTTSQLFAEPIAMDAATVQYLVGADGDAGETVLHYAAEPTVKAPEGVEKTWDAARGELRLNYTHGAQPQDVTITAAGQSPLTLRLINRTTAQTTWVLTAMKDGQATPVAVEGVELARTATFAGTKLELTGSVSQDSSLRVLAPAGTTAASWNGQDLGALSQGAATASLSGPSQVSEQSLSFVKQEDNAYAAVDYDDSAWTTAADTTSKQSQNYPGIIRYSNRDGNQQGPGRAGVVLDSNHYGFHNGSVWYRAHYTASSNDPTLRIKATASKGAPRQGRNPGFAQVWVNGQYAGAVSAEGGWQDIKSPTGSVQAGQPVVVAILVNNLGLSLDWSNGSGGGASQSKENRGLYDADLKAAGPVTWKIMGAPTTSAKDAANPSGTIYNNGGLQGEKAGWYGKTFDDSAWAAATDLHATTPGVTWYRAKVNLDVPAGQDTAFRLNLNSARFKSRADRSQATIFVNGWNTGVYIGDMGPQNSFTVPQGFLNLKGENTIAIAVASKEAGAGPDSVTLSAIHSTTMPEAKTAPEPSPTPTTSPSAEPTTAPTVEPTASPTTQPEPNATMPAYVSKIFADAPESVLKGDWDGDGTQSYAVRVGTRVVFYNENRTDAPVYASISIGRATDKVYVGDWDGDKRDTLALQRGTTVYYQTQLTSTATTKGTVPAGATLKVTKSGGKDVLTPQ
ncbi:Beta-galactosidase precursor [Actinomyces bovis]|uniref:beta-galactosidase n=1 Tax=Actinomyces bovis TaxID=1658 RepID=A0ABY1VNS5_9ACTO|nr:beta-galactosidase [Actinomyces bovis]SPT53574.1 Beta-galactosidase precursor [Actinomyces bovis]VEG55570.1 Beta-galactosidase precursor [Actinomyces israelii]